MHGRKEALEDLAKLQHNLHEVNFAAEEASASEASLSQIRAEKMARARACRHYLFQFPGRVGN